ncbi:MAG: recombinase zinc beta ribbon domain-containing protein [Clostridiales bacterium]|nr:recombinase zinc beta ribbon domain-containing protein [Clostridiales bacterium]
MVRRTITRGSKKYVYYNCSKNRKTHSCSPHSISEAKLREVVFHAIHDQIETVMHLDEVMAYMERLPMEDRRVFNYEAQITRLDEEIEQYKKRKLRLYEDLADGIITKTEYTGIAKHECRDGYASVFVGTVVWRPKTLGIQGESLANVHHG